MALRKSDYQRFPNGSHDSAEPPGIRHGMERRFSAAVGRQWFGWTVIHQASLVSTSARFHFSSPSGGWRDKLALMLLPIQVLGAALIVLGILVSRFSREISDWEKRLSKAHTWTRVTGWSGSQRGVIIWRVLGFVILAYGILLVAFTTHLGSTRRETPKRFKAALVSGRHVPVPSWSKPFDSGKAPPEWAISFRLGIASQIGAW